MTDATRTFLIESGREDVVKTHDLIQSGYAGVNRQGRIVDRRENPEVVPLPKNDYFNTPEPKKL